MTNSIFKSSKKPLLVIIGAFLAGVLYRAGGSGNYPRQTRIIGVPLVSLLVLGLLTGQGGLWLYLAYFLSFGLSCGAVSAYWNRKDADETYLNYYLHGLGLGFALLPYAIVTGHWLGFLIRLVVMPIILAFWTVKANKFKGRADIKSEVGRGVIIVLSILIMVICL